MLRQTSRHIGRAHGNRGAEVILAVTIIACTLAPLQAQTAGISGVIKNAAGEAVVGALVKVSGDKGLGFMVVSQEQGRYSTPNLLAGKYSVRGFGTNTQSAPDGSVEVANGRPGKLDLVLNVPLQIPPRAKPATDAELEKLLPDADNPFIKDKFLPVCSECHTLERILTARKTPEKWRETMHRMQYKLLGYRAPLHYKYPIQGIEDERMWKYLSENFGPDVPIRPLAVHPDRNLPGTLLKGSSAKYVAMEYSLAAGSEPTDIAIDSQGVAWVTESKTGMLGRFDPKTLTYSRIAAPPGKNPEFHLRAAAVDTQDRVWFADDSPKDARLLQYDPKDRKFNSYPIPDFRFPLPPDEWARIGRLRFLDGNLWASGMVTDRMLKLDLKTGTLSHYSVPRGSVPLDLVTDKDKKIWFAGQYSNRIYGLDPNDLGGEGFIAPYEAPTLRSDLRGLGIDGSGNLWVAAMNLGKLLKMDQTGKFTEYAPPTEGSGPFAVDVDAKRNLIWFSEVYSDKMARFDPKLNTFVEFPQSSADAEIQRIEVDRTNSNRIWWVSARTNKIGFLEVIE